MDKEKLNQLEDLGWRFIRYKDRVPSKSDFIKDIGEMI